MFKDHAPSRQAFPGFDDLESELHCLAREAGLIVRRTRSFSADGFLLAMLKAVCSGHASFNRLALSLGQSEARTISRQAVHCRMKKEAVTYLDAVLGRIVARRISTVDGQGEGLFRRILIQDSTQIRMHRGNHEAFPALDNNSGRTAGVKIDMRFDAVDGSALPLRQAPARIQDRVLGPDLLDEIQSGDLVIRDMGYFALAGFQTIEAKGAWWISRLHGLVEAKLPDGTALEDHLAGCRLERIDVPIFLGKAEHPARLIATRVPQQVASRRRAARRAKSAKQGHRPTCRALTRDDWTIHVTNIGVGMMAATAVAATYRLRWEVEIKFRAWKQSAGIARALSRISNEYHLKALVSAAMIYFVLTMKMVRMLAAMHPDKPLSFEKVCGWNAESLLRLTKLALPPPGDIRHLIADRRRRPRLCDFIRSLI